MQPAKALLPEGGFDPERLLSPGDALARYFALVALAPLGVECVPIHDAYGRILASDARADEDLPSVDRSAMDGFAVRSADVPGALRAVGEVPMGVAPGVRLAAGTTVRIPTGGVLPAGADAVVPIEDARVEGDMVRVDGAVAAGEATVARGSDILAGSCAIPAGTRLRSAHLGVLAALGLIQVEVYRRPRVAVISSGDELVDPATRPRPGEVRDSNRYAIAAALRGLGADPVHFPTAGDRPGELEASLRAALANGDAACVTGGSSVGARDRTPAAIDALGSPGTIVHGLRVKPGKPTVLAAIGGQPVIGLPGNPTSALMILQAVAAPIFGAMTGGAPVAQECEATLEQPLRSRPGWTWYVPVALRHEGERLLAQPLTVDSHSASLIARADGYVEMGERDEFWPAGTRVRVRQMV